MGLELTPEMFDLNLLIAREDGKDFSLTELPVGTMMLFADEDAKHHRGILCSVEFPVKASVLSQKG